MKRFILSDLNILVYGALMGFAGANGAFLNPFTASLSTLMFCGLVYLRYSNVTFTIKEETSMNYKMPSAQDIAEKMLQKNPQLNENYSVSGKVVQFSSNPQAERIQRKIQTSSPSFKKNLKEFNNLQQKQGQSLNDGSNVVDFELYKIKKMVNPKTDNAG